MSSNDETGLSARPLLLKFARPQRVNDRDYRYDPAQSLNVSLADGLPVVASAHGKSRLKTVKVFEGGEDH